VAAINGHAYAGGLITALGCDQRIASEGALQFSLNEVPIGIPMPAVYCEIIKYAIGPRAASEPIPSRQFLRSGEHQLSSNCANPRDRRYC
jgi:enoyl-CoA hydratase/carnithine racemase